MSSSSTQPVFTRHPLWLCLLPLFPCMALADEHTAKQDKETTTLPEVIVTAPLQDNNFARSYTVPSSSSATGFTLPLRKTPQSVSVITRQRIQDKDLHTLDQLIDDATGITVRTDMGTTYYESRGFRIDTIQQDDVGTFKSNSLMLPVRSAGDMQDMNIYERVEVIRGGTGLMRSDGQPGGLINLIRKKPTKKTQASANLSIGRWDNYRIGADVSGSLNAAQSLRGRIVVSADKAGSFQDYRNSHHLGLYGVLSADLGEKTVLDLGMHWQDNHEVPDLHGLALNNDGTDPHLPRSTYWGAAWNRWDSRRLNTFAEIRHQFNDHWNITGKIDYTESEADNQLASLGSPAGRNSPPDGIDAQRRVKFNGYLKNDNMSRTAAALVRLDGKFNWFERQHEILATLTHSRQTFGNEYSYNFKRPLVDIDTFNPGNVSYPDWYGAGFFQGEVRRRYSDWGLSLGTRWALTDSLHFRGLGSKITIFSDKLLICR